MSAATYKAEIVAFLKATPTHVVKIKVPADLKGTLDKTRYKCKLHLVGSTLSVLGAEKHEVKRDLGAYLKAEHPWVPVANAETRKQRILASK